jgi:hypothetical protein
MHVCILFIKCMQLFDNLAIISVFRSVVTGEVELWEANHRPALPRLRRQKLKKLHKKWVKLYLFLTNKPSERKSVLVLV